MNLIPLNPTPGSEWDASPQRVQEEFVARVRAGGVACTVRDTRGREIDAACGQLAASAKLGPITGEIDESDVARVSTRVRRC